MEIRKLESAEHGKTRFLWEKIFKEDSQTFVDYYYFIRTKENVIYVVEEDGAIRSMLQKNPYWMKLEDSVLIRNILSESQRKRSTGAEGICGSF